MKREKNAGFSLVEVLVAVTILALVVAPLLYSFVTAVRINSQSKRSMEAAAAAQNVMEQVTAADWAELGLTDHGDGTFSREALETFNGKTFRIKTTLDANPYKRENDTEPEQFNDLELPDIYGMDRARDGLYIQDQKMDEHAFESFYLTDSSFSMMKRSMVLYIKDGRNHKPEVTLDIVYEYNGRTRYKERGAVLFQNASAEKTLQGVYLFFQPMYTSGGGIKEELSVINETDSPVDVYLVKQENDRTTPGAESGYQVKVDVQEPYYDGEEGGAWVPLTRIRTNLSDSQAVMTYNGAPEKTVAGTVYAAETLVGRQPLSGQVKKERIYEVRVEVYDEAGESRAVLTGTKEK